MGARTVVEVADLPAAAGSGQRPGGAEAKPLTAGEAACLDLLAEAPVWWPRDAGWIAPAMQRDLATRPGITVDGIRLALADVRKRHARRGIGPEVRNWAGLLIGAIKQQRLEPELRAAEAYQARRSGAVSAPAAWSEHKGTGMRGDRGQRPAPAPRPQDRRTLWVQTEGDQRAASPPQAAEREQPPAPAGDVTNAEIADEYARWKELPYRVQYDAMTRTAELPQFRGLRQHVARALWIRDNAFRREALAVADRLRRGFYAPDGEAGEDEQVARWNALPVAVRVEAVRLLEESSEEARSMRLSPGRAIYSVALRPQLWAAVGRVHKVQAMNDATGPATGEASTHTAERTVG